MAKASFANMKLKAVSEVKTITINDIEVEVKQYLPAEEKKDILQMVVQLCDGTILDTFSADCLFHLYIVFAYTNINFTDKQKEDLYGLYDILETNGVIEKIVKEIPEIEYKILSDSMVEMIQDYKAYKNSAGSMMESLMMFAPNQSEQLKQNLAEMDIDKIAQIIDIAGKTGYENEQ